MVTRDIDDLIVRVLISILLVVHAFELVVKVF